MGFMVSHDMQCVYILECSDEKSRARNYAIVKAVAILGTLLVPLLRATLMQKRKRALARCLSRSCNYRFCDVIICIAFAKGKQTRF